MLAISITSALCVYPNTATKPIGGHGFRLFCWLPNAFENCFRSMTFLCIVPLLIGCCYAHDNPWQPWTVAVTNSARAIWGIGFNTILYWLWNYCSAGEPGCTRVLPPPVICKDKVPDCTRLASFCEDPQYKFWSIEKCPKTCNKCALLNPLRKPYVTCHSMTIFLSKCSQGHSNLKYVTVPPSMLTNTNMHHYVAPRRKVWERYVCSMPMV